MKKQIVKEQLLFELPEEIQIEEVHMQRPSVEIKQSDNWTEISFFLLYPRGKTNPNGDPVAKQSVRSSIMPMRKNTGKRIDNELYYRIKDLRVHHYQPAYLEHVKEKLSEQARLFTNGKIDKPFEKTVHIDELVFHFNPLKSFSKKVLQQIRDGEIIEKNTKPDMMDNLSKILFDSLSGIVFKDDGLISFSRNVSKIYSFTPGVYIRMLCK